MTRIAFQRQGQLLRLFGCFRLQTCVRVKVAADICSYSPAETHLRRIKCQYQTPSRGPWKPAPLDILFMMRVGRFQTSRTGSDPDLCLEPSCLNSGFRIQRTFKINDRFSKMFSAKMNQILVSRGGGADMLLTFISRHICCCCLFFFFSCTLVTKHYWMCLNVRLLSGEHQINTRLYKQRLECLNSGLRVRKI